MKKLYFIITLVLAANALNAQTQNLGEPLSFSRKVTLTKKGYSLPEIDNSREYMFYSQEAAVRGEKLLQYGKPCDVNIDFFKQAEKQTLPSGINLYRFFIESPTAISLNIIFTKFRLEQGTVLYIFNEDKSRYIGAYTSLNNNSSNELGTELLYSKKIYIEVQEPAANAGKSQLEIGRVIHGFIHLDEHLEKSLNDSGDCNIDVNCPQGNGWEIPRNGVAMLVNGNGGFCSGSMVNNTSGTVIPYFLTANHCGSGPGSWIFRFRWESPENTMDCSGTSTGSGNGPETMNINGGITRANYAPSDFHLIELNSIPPDSWEVTYNGWNRSGETPQSGAGIHHPSGDIKKIALSSSPYVSDSYFTADETHWHVFWSDGVTEGGSSGSPVFDQYRRIVGQLHGGSSACGSDDLSDFYGKFYLSWSGGGTPETRLSDWLDPQNTDVGFIDGNVTNSLDAYFTSGILGVGASTLCSGNMTPQIVLTNGGNTVMTTAIINYTVDGVNTPIPWQGSLGLFESDTVDLPALDLPAGNHTITVTVSAPNDTTDENPDNNTAASEFLVILNGQNLVLEINFDCYAGETSWEIIDNNNQVLFSEGNYASTDEPYTVTRNLCLNNGCYDLVIYDSWGDGMTSSDCDTGSVYLYNSEQEIITSVPENEASFGNNIFKNFCLGNNGIPAKEKSNLLVYPNPFSSTIKVVSPSELIRTVEITDLTGKIVFRSAEINAYETTLNPGIKNGSYLLLIHTDSEKIIEKILK